MRVQFTIRGLSIAILLVAISCFAMLVASEQVLLIAVTIAIASVLVTACALPNVKTPWKEWCVSYIVSFLVLSWFQAQSIVDPISYCLTIVWPHIVRDADGRIPSVIGWENEKELRPSQYEFVKVGCICANIIIGLVAAWITSSIAEAKKHILVQDSSG